MQLDVIGIGVGEQATLTPEASRAITEAHWLIGADRQLETVASLPGNAQHKQLPTLSELKQWLQPFEQSDQRLVLLASGDPLFYGIGSWIQRNFSEADIRFHANVSSIQAACHSVGWALQDLTVVSLHGRPKRRLRSKLGNHQRYAVLTDSQSQPHLLAAELLQSGFEQSTLIVCERLGYPNQKITHHRAIDIAEPMDVDPLHVTLIDCRGRGGVLPEFPGIPDHHFSTDGDTGRGLLTKREVRLQVLSLLQPAAGEIGWDIGAGCGGVAIEWARWTPGAQIYAIEHHNGRIEHLEHNRDRFGVDANLNVITGRAPAALADLPAPDRIFIGGSGGEMKEIFQHCWQQLKSGGVMVATAVTENSKLGLQQLTAPLAAQPGNQLEWLDIAVSREDRLAGQLLMRPQLPVRLMKLSKGAAHV